MLLTSASHALSAVSLVGMMQRFRSSPPPGYVSPCLWSSCHNAQAAFQNHEHSRMSLQHPFLVRMGVDAVAEWQCWS